MLKQKTLVQGLIILLTFVLAGSVAAECGWGCTADRLTKAGEDHRSSGNPVRGIVGAVEGGIELVMDFLDWAFDISGAVPGGGSDPDYQNPASLAGPVDFVLFDDDSEVGVLVNTAFVQAGLAMDNGRLAQSSVWKHNGALAAGDAQAAAARATEGRVYLDAAEGYLLDVASSLDLLSLEVDNQGEELPPISFAQLLSFRASVIAEGYPQEELLMADTMLITQQEMNGMLQVFEGRGLPGVGPDDLGDDLLRRAADQLRSVDLRANLPAAFQ